MAAAQVTSRETGTAPESVNSQMSIKDVYAQLCATFNNGQELPMYAISHDGKTEVVKQGYKRQQGNFVSPDWDNVAYEIQQRGKERK